MTCTKGRSTSAKAVKAAPAINVACEPATSQRTPAKALAISRMTPLTRLNLGPCLHVKSLTKQLTMLIYYLSYIAIRMFLLLWIPCSFDEHFDALHAVMAKALVSLLSSSSFASLTTKSLRHGSNWQSNWVWNHPPWRRNKARRRFSSTQSD